MADDARWWDLRPAQGQQAKTYTCPICHGRFMAMIPNVLMSPEGDRAQRRHAHIECVARQRAAGKLRTRSEWKRDQRASGPERPTWWLRTGLFRRSTRTSGS